MQWRRTFFQGLEQCPTLDELSTIRAFRTREYIMVKAISLRRDAINLQVMVWWSLRAQKPSQASSPQPSFHREYPCDIIGAEAFDCAKATFSRVNYRANDARKKITCSETHVHGNYICSMRAIWYRRTTQCVNSAQFGSETDLFVTACVQRAVSSNFLTWPIWIQEINVGVQTSQDGGGGMLCISTAPWCLCRWSFLPTLRHRSVTRDSLLQKYKRYSQSCGIRNAAFGSVPACSHCDMW